MAHLSRIPLQSNIFTVDPVCGIPHHIIMSHLMPQYGANPQILLTYTGTNAWAQL